MIKRAKVFTTVQFSVALLIGFALPTLSAGTIVFNNLAAPSGGSRSLVPDAQFQSFSTGAGSFSLTDVMLLLSGGLGPTDTTSFSVDLYADSSTSPGSFLFNIGMKIDNTLTANCSCTYDFPTTAFALSANTRYWIGLKTSTGSAVDWDSEFVSGAVPPGDIGVAGQFRDDTGTVSPDDFNGFRQAFQMEVTVSPTVTTSGVPEPSTLVLGAAGLLALMIVRRQTRRA
jgi:PEP-CTERM motif-containing protein